MSRYTNVTERHGERLDATYRRVVDVTIARSPHTWADYVCSAYVGGHALTWHSYAGYSWREVKRLFKREIDDAIEACYFEARGARA